MGRPMRPSPRKLTEGCGTINSRSCRKSKNRRVISLTHRLGWTHDGPARTFSDGESPRTSRADKQLNQAVLGRWVIWRSAAPPEAWAALACKERSDEGSTASARVA